jgi:signal peptidase I
MLPSLTLGQSVVVDEDAYQTSLPSVGDVVVFYGPLDITPAQISAESATVACDQTRRGPGSSSFIKRVVAGGGDVISIRKGFVTRNGLSEPRDHIKAGDELVDQDFPTPIVIPVGTWYVLGDNRAQSIDSRHWGPIPTDWIVGKVQLTDEACRQSTSQIGSRTSA